MTNEEKKTPENKPARLSIGKASKLVRKLARQLEGLGIRERGAVLRALQALSDHL